MQEAITLKVTITAEHTIQLPEEVPAGPAEIIILVGVASGARRSVLAERRRVSMGTAAGQFVVPEDFNAPLPPEILGLFEGDNVGPIG